MNLLFFGSDYQVGLTMALSEQLIELKKIDSINLYAVSSQNEMEKGLHQKMKDSNINMSIVNDLDEHKNFKQLAKQIETVINTNYITHINVHNNWQLGLVSYIKYKNIVPKKFKIIYTIHGYRHNSSIKSIFAIAIIGMALLLFADRVISMSSYVSKKFWFVKYKTDIVYYIMSKPEFNKKENIIEPSPMKMVFPAQFRHGKEQWILIQAVSQYINKTQDKTIQLYLPGDGEELPKYKQMVIDLNIADNVIFPGKMAHKDVIDLYEQCNIALVSSNVETYGRCIAEPFALGRCLITKKTGVALDIIKEGENGFMYSKVDELAGILEKLHNDPDKIVEVGNNAFKDKKVFSAEHVMNTYLESLKKA